MKKGKVLAIFVISLVFLSLFFSFVSASWFSDAWNKITGKVVGSVNDSGDVDWSEFDAEIAARDARFAEYEAANNVCCSRYAEGSSALNECLNKAQCHLGYDEEEYTYTEAVARGLISPIDAAAHGWDMTFACVSKDGTIGGVGIVSDSSNLASSICRADGEINDINLTAISLQLKAEFAALEKAYTSCDKIYEIGSANWTSCYSAVSCHDQGDLTFAEAVARRIVNASAYLASDGWDTSSACVTADGTIYGIGYAANYDKENTTIIFSNPSSGILPDKIELLKANFFVSGSQIRMNESLVSIDTSVPQPNTYRYLPEIYPSMPEIANGTCIDKKPDTRAFGFWESSQSSESNLSLNYQGWHTCLRISNKTSNYTSADRWDFRLRSRGSTCSNYTPTVICPYSCSGGRCYALNYWKIENMVSVATEKTYLRGLKEDWSYFVGINSPGKFLNGPGSKVTLIQEINNTVFYRNLNNIASYSYGCNFIPQYEYIDGQFRQTQAEMKVDFMDENNNILLEDTTGIINLTQENFQNNLTGFSSIVWDPYPAGKDPYMYARNRYGYVWKYKQVSTLNGKIPAQTKKVIFKLLGSNMTSIRECSFKVTYSENAKALAALPAGQNLVNSSDSDGDGVNNSVDVCANTPAGKIVNLKGCPLPQFAKFQNFSTNLNNVDLKNVANFSLANEYGSISFLENVSLVRNGNSLNLDSFVDISPRRISVDSVSLPELNKSAVLRFNNVSYTQASLLRDGISCEECNFSYSNRTISLTVEHFSTFEVIEKIESIGSPEFCVANWSCGEWSSCLNNLQNRTCVDSNSCNDSSYFPVSVRTCVSSNCIPQWSCSEWSSCVNEEKTRLCGDLNSCNIDSGKPEESSVCSVEEESLSSNRLVLINTILIIVIILIIISLIVFYLVWFFRFRKKEEKENVPVNQNISPVAYQGRFARR